MKIALAQINTTVGDLKQNQKKILNYIIQAKKKKADIVVFPELALCGYPPEDLLLKKHFVDDNIALLRGLVKSTTSITAVVGFVDRDEKGKIYNAAAVLSNGKYEGAYHKKELPNYGVFDEKRYFSKGKHGGLFKIKGKAVGISICEDIWTPKGVCVRQAESGADILINCSSSPFDISKIQRRKKVLKKKAQLTKRILFYVNCVGGQDELVFDGNSMVVNKQGKIIARGQSFKEDLLVFDCTEMDKTDVIKKEASQIENIYNALVLGTRDYVRKNGFKKVVIGSSGGIDSAVVTAIATKALGKANVATVTMPSEFTSKGTYSDSKTLAKNLGIDVIDIPIKKAVGCYADLLAGQFAGMKPNIAEENIQARIRGNILMALSNKFGHLVLTTGNKSETAVGYCTLYGDMSGGFAVIKDVPKTKVYEVAEYINRNKEVIPKSIIERPPTAELRENQKDQDSLPDYPTLDAILDMYVEQNMSFEDISGEFNPDIVKKVIKLIDHNEYKRRQAAPGIKVTSRAFGRDWRLPITNKYCEFD